MGRAAPVGTLLLTRPTSVRSVEVGDIVTFHPPNSTLVYSHRVIARSAAGLRTRGDVNAMPDPWTLTDSNLIGKVQARWWAAGWVLRGAPLLLLGLAVIWLISVFLAPALRSPVRVMGAAVSASVVGFVLHPWIGLQRLSSSISGHAVAINLVSTGILPVRAAAQHGSRSTDLVNGQVGTVRVGLTGNQASYNITGDPHFSLWWWVVVVLVCLSPLVWTMTFGLAPADE
jgi:hypothetical protein